MLAAATADRPKSFQRPLDVDRDREEGEVFVDQIADEVGEEEEEDDSWIPWPDSSGGFSE